MKKLVAAACVAWGIGAALVAEECPTVRVPFDSNAIKTDGVVEAGEWDSAAVIRALRPLGGHGLPPQETEFRIKHDGERVYVLARCFETDARYPESYSRTWDDSFLRNDDCIEVVFGVADPELRDRGRIDVGGYEGAMDGAVVAADEYFSFAVNASGSCQRQYNEMPIKNGGFKQACRRGTGEWTVEMSIPRSAMRLPPLGGTKAFANFFRHRPPQMLGWHLPAFGGYASMPFGQVEFLSAGGVPTVEEPIGVAQTPSAQAPNGDGRLTVSIEYGPLNHAVVGVVSVEGGDVDGLEASLEVSGVEGQREKLVFSSGCDRDGNPLPQRKALVVCTLPAGDQPKRTAVLKVFRKGELVTEQTRTCAAAKMPEWLGTKEACEYEEDVIPQPWTKPVIEGGRVRLVDKTLTFSRSPFPSSVLREGALSATFRKAPHLRVVTGGRVSVLEFADLKLTPEKNRVRLTGMAKAAGLTCRAFGLLDYDGFLDCTLAVEGEACRSVERIEFVLPLESAAARHFLPGINVQNGGRLSSAGWRGAETPFWIGNEQEGLFFNYDESPFRGKDRRHAISIAAVKGGMDAVLAFADAPGQIGAEGETFRFFLQPTPTKPYPREPVRQKTQWWWEGWSSYHGYPDLSKTNAVRDMVKKEAQEGRALTLYCCQGLQEDAPEMAAWRDDFSLKPDWCYYRWQNHACFATCKRGPEGDFQIARYAQLIRETGISGLMSDGLTVAWGCDNVLHAHGCGQPMKPSLDHETLSRTVAQRRFLKRIRGLFDRTHRPFCLVAHTGGGIDANSLSFFDAYFEGEQLMRFRRGYYPPRELYSIGYTGLPWGWRTIYWPKQLHNFNGLDSALVYALLHNSEFYANPNVEPPNADTDILLPFSTEDTVFRPYWKKQRCVGFVSDEAKLSVYEKPDELLLVVGNLRPYACDYTLKLSALWPGQAWQAEDLLLKRPIASADLTESLKPFSCRVIRVKRGQAAAPSAVAAEPSVPPVRVVTDPSKWTFENAKAGSVSSDGVLDLAASPERGAALAKYAEPFGRDLTIEGDADLSSRFVFMLGDQQHFTYGPAFPGWGWMLVGKANPYGRGWIYGSVALNPGKMVPFRLVLSKGVLDVWYGGQRVVRNLALDLPASGNRLTVKTWHDDKLKLKAK